MKKCEIIKRERKIFFFGISIYVILLHIHCKSLFLNIFIKIGFRVECYVIFQTNVRNIILFNVPQHLQQINFNFFRFITNLICITVFHHSHLEKFNREKNLNIFIFFIKHFTIDKYSVNEKAVHCYNPFPTISFSSTYNTIT